ncbi:MAG: C39 family peptidase [Clostridia bacterium]|nr:C39 family peptidase [Clostridia bacterium]
MNNKYFIHHDFYNMKKTNSLHLIENFKTFKQSYDNTCGPVCVQMVLNYYNDLKEEDYLKEVCKTRPYPYGTYLLDLCNGIKDLGYDIISSIDKSNDKPTFEEFKAFVISCLNNNEPIIVENIDYGGHYKVIIGYDEINDNPGEDMLIFADPYDLNDGLDDGYNYFPADRFFYMWYDLHCLEEEYRVRPYVVIKRKIIN